MESNPLANTCPGKGEIIGSIFLASPLEFSEFNIPADNAFNKLHR